VKGLKKGKGREVERGKRAEGEKECE